MTRRLEPMIRYCMAGLVLMILALGSANAGSGRLMLSGAVHALDAEAIFVPMSDVSPVVLRYLAEEGARVEPGDVLARVDPGQSLSRLEQLDAEIEQASARAAKELAELRVKEIDAQIALVQARAVRDKAEVDAGIPREHLSALDFDRYAGEYERARREHELKREELMAARAAVARRQAEAGIEQEKLTSQRAYHLLTIETSEQRATRAGTVRFGFDPRAGQRYSEGMSVHAGRQIGEVAVEGRLGVRAWALEPERAALAIGQAVQLQFDALAGVVLPGHIERISGAPEEKAEWGEGRYFEVEIGFDQPDIELQLLPGMSVRVDVQAPASTELASQEPLP